MMPVPYCMVGAGFRITTRACRTHCEGSFGVFGEFEGFRVGILLLTVSRDSEDEVVKEKKDAEPLRYSSQSE